MKLIVGLGNPGVEYKGTRHNVGFMCVEYLRTKLALDGFEEQKKFEALVAEGNHEDEKIIIAKPQTFMNLSGKSVSALFNFYKCEPADLWIVFDDIDLELGRIRIRSGGTGGTHNGMKSIIESLGFHNFPRIRIGIESRGSSAPAKQDISSFVLHPFTKEELPVAEKSVKIASDALLTGLKEGISAAMDRYN